MKELVLDAAKLMEQPDPIEALASIFGFKGSDLYTVQMALSAMEEDWQVSVINKPEGNETWMLIADLLEGVQQHSAHFFLIWSDPKERAKL